MSSTMMMASRRVLNVNDFSLQPSYPSQSRIINNIRNTTELSDMTTNKVEFLTGTKELPIIKKDSSTTEPNASNINDDSIKQQATNNARIPRYIHDHCDLTGVDHWMVPEDDWRRRTPVFLILGAKKGGTTGLYASLTSHPKVLRARKKELLFFIPKRFSYWTNNEIGGKVKVAEARKSFFQQFKRKIIQEDSTLITGEATPDYILYSEYSSQAILCTVPWVKVIVLLRDPIERLFSHYNFISDPTRLGLKLPKFETWVNREISVLQSYGVLPQNLSTSEINGYMGSNAERQGWLRYQSSINRALQDRAFVRSMYALQLEDWYRNLRAIGKDPETDLRIVLSRDAQSNVSVVEDLLRWLGIRSRNLPPLLNATNTTTTSTLSTEAKIKTSMVTTYSSSPIPQGLELWLKSFFRPYNERLYRLLGKRYEGIFDAVPPLLSNKRISGRLKNTEMPSAEYSS